MPPRLLMCAPNFFNVTYEINAWMRIENAPDPALAHQQWQDLYNILTQKVGAEVHLLTPQPGFPDMVFTANAGICQGTVFVPSRFRFQERQGEVPFYTEWCAAHGFTIDALAPDPSGSFEGEGDALFYGDTLLAGYRMRSDAAVYRVLARMLGRQVLPLELADTRWYHLDTCLIPLRPDLLAYYPPAFDSYANTVLENLPGDKIVLNEHDALRFGGNAVVLGENVVMNAGCDALAEEIEKRGMTVFATDTGEFLKSGGSAKCLTLVLDH